ncbi:putative reverse transcriptase domain-containing protein [Tanacetum coccineum]
MHHTSISSAERSWSIPAMDPYKEAALQAPEQAPPLPDYVPGPEYPEYLAPSNNEIPDPEEDPTDYLADEGEDDEEEESSMVMMEEEVPSPPLPLPSPPLLLPSTTHRIDIPEAEMPPWKRACFTALSHSIRASKGRMMTTVDEVNGRITDLATTHRQDVEEDLYAHQVASEEYRFNTGTCIHTLEGERQDAGDMVTRAFGRIHALEARDPSIVLKSKMAPKKTTTPMTDVAIKGLIAPGVADALAEYEANKNSRNEDDNHESGSGKRRTKRTAQSDEVKKYVGVLPDMIQGSVMTSKPKTMQDAVEFANDLMDQKIRTFADRQAENKRKLDDNLRNNQNQQQPYKRSFVSTAFSSLIDIVPTTLDHNYDVKLADRKIIRVNTIIWGCTLNFLNHPFNIDLMTIELGSFYVIIGMDWLSMYNVIIVYDEKIVRIPFGNETLIVRGDVSNNGHESRLNIISCTKTQKYLMKGCHVFLAHVTIKKAEDKSEEKRFEDVPFVRDFPEVFPEDLPGIPPT